MVNDFLALKNTLASDELFNIALFDLFGCIPLEVISEHMNEMLICDITSGSSSNNTPEQISDKIDNNLLIMTCLRNLDITLNSICLTDQADKKAIKEKIDKIDLFEFEELIFRALMLWIHKDELASAACMSYISSVSHVYNEVFEIFELCNEIHQKLTTTQN